MNWFNFGELLSYLICFSGTETEDENNVEEEGESASEQLTDVGTKDSLGTTLSIGIECGKLLPLLTWVLVLKKK